jgi:hypothetical protein
MILFEAELVPLIREGRKTQTRRYWFRPRVKVGAVHRVNTDYITWAGLSIRILRVWEEDPEAISEADARAEGFTGRDDFLSYFHSINDKRRPGDVAARKPFAVEFEVAR